MIGATCVRMREDAHRCVSKTCACEKRVGGWAAGGSFCTRARAHFFHGSRELCLLYCLPILEPQSANTCRMLSFRVMLHALVGESCWQSSAKRTNY